MDLTIDEMIGMLNEWRERSAQGGETKVRMGLASYRCAPAVDFQDSAMVVDGDDESTLWLAVGTAADYCPDIWNRNGDVVSAAEAFGSYDEDEESEADDEEDDDADADSYDALDEDDEADDEDAADCHP